MLLLLQSLERRRKVVVMCCLKENTTFFIFLFPGEDEVELPQPPKSPYVSSSDANEDESGAEEPTGNDFAAFQQFSETSMFELFLVCFIFAPAFHTCKQDSNPCPKV